MHDDPQIAPGRVFPRITRDLYQTTTVETKAPNVSASRRILALAGKQLTIKQRYFSQNLDPETRTTLILSLHKRSIAAESEGRFSRANFLWRKFHVELAEIIDRDDHWTALTSIFAGDSGNFVDPSKLRHCFIEELVIATHLAFYGSYVTKKERSPIVGRAQLHWEYVKQLLARTTMSEEHALSLLSQPVKEQVQGHCRNGRWAEALQDCELILKYAPGNTEFIERWATVYFLQTVNLTSTGNEPARRVVNQLLTAEAELNALQQKIPFNVAVLEMLGRINFLLSVNLVELGLLSQALVASHKALLFFPELENGRETAADLEEMMKNTQTKMKEFEEKNAKQSGLELNAFGQILQAEAAKGFEPLNEYIRSEEAQAVSRTRLAAEARDVWTQIGWPLTVGANSGELELIALNAVRTVFASGAESEEDITARWQDQVSRRPELGSLDPIPACAFILRSLHPERDSAPVAESEVATPNPDAFPVSSRKRFSLGEPADYWFFARNNWGVKLRAAAVILVLLLVTGVMVRERTRRNVRNDAYQRIVEESSRRHHPEVLDYAESFLSHPPLRGEDGRKDQVVRYYNEALLRFVAQQTEGELSPVALARIDRYRQLVGVTK